MSATRRDVRPWVGWGWGGGGAPATALREPLVCAFRSLRFFVVVIITDFNSINRTVAQKMAVEHARAQVLGLQFVQTRTSVPLCVLFLKQSGNAGDSQSPMTACVPRVVGPVLWVVTLGDEPRPTHI